ncbi:hypothetical protein [Sulfolobus sp. S-194]|nr:hypothetical protein [Sulfolobus sp. S-194]
MVIIRDSFFTPSMFNAFKRGGANFIKAEDYIAQIEGKRLHN